MDVVFAKAARYVPKCFLRRILMLASFCATPNSISTSPHNIRAFEVAVGVVWSQETGACAGSVRYPPSRETTKNALASCVVLLMKILIVRLSVVHVQTPPPDLNCARITGKQQEQCPLFLSLFASRYFAVVCEEQQKNKGKMVTCIPVHAK